MTTENIFYAVVGFTICLILIILIKRIRRGKGKVFTYIPPNRFNFYHNIDDRYIISWSFYDKNIPYKYVKVKFLRNFNIDSIKGDCEKEYQIKYWL